MKSLSQIPPLHRATTTPPSHHLDDARITIQQDPRTCVEKFESGVGQVHGDEVLEPDDGWVGVAGGAAQHNGVTVLLHGLQGRALRDARVPTRHCKNK